MSSITNFNVMSDVLASEGIINYDAQAYVRGTRPRYVGKPFTYANSGSLIYPTSGCGIYSNPYEKYRIGTTCGGDAFFRNGKPCRGSCSGEFLKKLGLVGILAYGINRVISKFSKKLSGLGKNAKQKVDVTTNNVKNTKAAEKTKGIFSRIPKKFKILGALALGAFGAYKVATHNAKQAQTAGTIHSTPNY